MKFYKKKLGKFSFKFSKEILIIIFFSILIIFSLFLFFIIKGDILKKEDNLVFIPKEEIFIDNNFSADIYFNDDLGSNIFSEKIIEAINISQEKVEIAVYSINDDNIFKAINNAVKRGVEVDLILSQKTSHFLDLSEDSLLFGVNIYNIPYEYSTYEKAYLMHHKFLIVDRGFNNETLFFGSYNFTEIQEKYDPSFLIKTNDSTLVSVFGEEFDRIKKGFHGFFKIEDDFNPFVAKINYSNGFIEVWFTPSNKTNNLRSRMISLARESRSNIKMMIWFWTDNVFAREILNLSNVIDIKIITDDFNFFADHSVFKDILINDKTKNLEIIDDSKRQDEMFALGEERLNSFLHQHTMIVDDSLVLTGTNNWSRAGFFHNDESIIISNIPFVVNKFKESFDINYFRNK